MKDRTSSLLVFADLAFFLFAVLAFGYHYMDQKDADSTLRHMSIQLPFLRQDQSDKATRSETDTARLTLQVRKDGSCSLNGADIPIEQLQSALGGMSDVRHGHLEVDRECTAQQTISALASLNSLNLRGLSIGTVQAEESP